MGGILSNNFFIMNSFLPKHIHPHPIHTLPYLYRIHEKRKRHTHAVHPKIHCTKYRYDKYSEVTLFLKR